MYDEKQPSDAALAHRYRLAQARTILRCYEASTGTPARTTDELETWLAANPGAVPVDTHGSIIPDANTIFESRS